MRLQQILHDAKLWAKLLPFQSYDTAGLSGTMDKEETLLSLPSQGHLHRHPNQPLILLLSPAPTLAWDDPDPGTRYKRSELSRGSYVVTERLRYESEVHNTINYGTILLLTFTQRLGSHSPACYENTRRPNRPPASMATSTIATPLSESVSAYLAGHSYHCVASSISAFMPIAYVSANNVEYLSSTSRIPKSIEMPLVVQAPIYCFPNVD